MSVVATASPSSGNSSWWLALVSVAPLPLLSSRLQISLLARRLINSPSRFRRSPGFSIPPTAPQPQVLPPSLSSWRRVLRARVSTLRVVARSSKRSQLQRRLCRRGPRRHPMAHYDSQLALPLLCFSPSAPLLHPCRPHLQSSTLLSQFCSPRSFPSQPASELPRRDTELP